MKANSPILYLHGICDIYRFHKPKVSVTTLNNNHFNAHCEFSSMMNDQTSHKYFDENTIKSQNNIYGHGSSTKESKKNLAIQILMFMMKKTLDIDLAREIEIYLLNENIELINFDDKAKY
jgi:hypothetical protein